MEHVRRFDHIVFDLDGTLADTAADLAAATNHVLRSFGRSELPLEEIRGYVGDGARRLIERALQGAADERVDEGLQRFLAYYGDHLLEHTALYGGIAAVLARLVAGGLTLSVLTNKPAVPSRAILAGLGVLAHFAHIVGGDSGLPRKPDPAGLAALMQRARISRERTLLVGDSRIDLQTARNGGVGFCGVQWGFAPASLAAMAAPMIDHPGELLAVVGI
jgi:phosphoglycolate phosphatase